jgi:hypothetical protein
VGRISNGAAVTIGGIVFRPQIVGAAGWPCVGLEATVMHLINATRTTELHLQLNPRAVLQVQSTRSNVSQSRDWTGQQQKISFARFVTFESFQIAPKKNSNGAIIYC